MDHACDLPDKMPPCRRLEATFLSAAWRRFPRFVGDLSILARTFHVRPPGDASILIIVPVLMFTYPLSK
jgi:hypothetical protein